jgi:signal transduction histidine kinase/CheY-like chemotaxis protein
MNNLTGMEHVYRFLSSILTARPGRLNDFFDVLLAEILELVRGDFGFIVIRHDDRKLFKKNLHMPGYPADRIADYIILHFNTLFFDSDNFDLLNINVLIPEEINKEFSGGFNKLSIIPLDTIEGIKPFIVLLSSDVLSPETIGSLIEPLSALVSLHTGREECEIKMSEALESDRRKSAYLTGFAHEIKTPLNALAGFSQLLREPLIYKEQFNKYLEIITMTSEKMINLINYFNEVTEIETGRLRIMETTVNLRELITGVCSSFTDRFKEKGLHFEKSIFFTDKEGIILTDENKLAGILNVLLSNSYFYSYSGSVKFSSRLVQDYITFCVSDTGIGIPESAKNHLFDYSEYGSSLIKNSNGSGLGLIISKSYIEMMGGRIWFDSTEGQGSSFYFSIPYKPAAVFSDLHPKSVSGPQHLTGRKIILVAEDDNLNFSLIKTFLSGLDVDILRAENGKEAVDIASGTKIDLVLMDIRMPVMDGYTASRLIKNVNPSLKIIAQTAYSDRSVAILNGCDDFITKPFGRQQLISLVSTYL